MIIVDLKNLTIVDMDRLRENKFTLAVNSYIEKSPAPPIYPKKVRSDFIAALQRVKDCEARMIQLLQEGGYIDG